MIARRRRKTQGEPTVTLINIVFLMLIFFMVAGTLSSPPDSAISFVQSNDLECCASPDALSISASGDLARNGEAYASPQDYLAAYPAAGEGVGEPLRILPDQSLPAARLLEILSQLQASGAGSISLLAENGA